MIPPELWRQATRLARRYGVSVTSRALRLDYGALRRRLEAETPPARVAATPPAFVEITPSMPNGCVIEVEDARGTKLTVRFERAQDLLALAGLLGRGA